MISRTWSPLLAAAALALAPVAATAQVEIETWLDLHNIRNNLSGDYVLVNDLGPSDPGYDMYASAAANDGAGWLPIGDSGTFFTGALDGQGHTITGLFMDRPESHLGLFGGVFGGEIKNLGLADVEIISGAGQIGALAGFLRGTVTNCWSTGTITGGSDQAGGLVGSGNVIMDSSWSGVNVTSTSWVGGLAGFLQMDSAITNSYAVGSATATRTTSSSHASGLVADLMGTLSTSFAAVTVTASPTGVPRGLVADLGAAGSVDDSYWDTVIAGTDTSEGGGTPLTTAQMKGAAAATHMSALDFSDVWITVQEGVAINGITPEADGYPILRHLAIEPQLAAQAPRVPADDRARGDFDGDGCVGFQDFIFLLDEWGNNVDGTPMGFTDFVAMLNNWGDGC